MSMMNQRPNKQSAVTGSDAWMFFGTVALVAIALVGFGTAWLAATLAGHGHGGPVRWLLAQGEGPRWSGLATMWALILSSLLVAAVVGIVRMVRSSMTDRPWVDSLASSMSNKDDLAEMTEEAVRADTERLESEAAGEGVRLGIAAQSKEWLLATYEWSQLWIMGTRAGKTRSVAVPHLVEHKGAAVATSNKPDIVYLSRGPRSELGRVWIQDPQDIYGEGATWWWNPLSFVTSIDRAEELASIWLASRTSGEVPQGEDAYFGPMGRELLTDLLFAAALGGAPVTRVKEWLEFPDGRPGMPDPQEILRKHGYDGVADSIESKIGAASDERSGIFGTARSGTGFLRNPAYLPWITRMGEDDDRPEFRPNEFVTTTQTLYLLSKGGKASGARAITGSLTAAVYGSAEVHAERNGGRVPTPILFVLDEAANVCRWPELPSLYSHAGGKGLILITILQSKEQGEGAWGKSGFGMMWSAANIAVAGRGINDDEHLSELSALIGDRQIRDKSLSTGTRGHRSTSVQNRDERILTVADLRALPRGRAVLFAAGARPILLEVVDYSQREDGDRIEASKDAFKLRLDETDDKTYKQEELMIRGAR